MPTIEYVTVANHAEAINGLLYLHGAGWTDMSLSAPSDGPLSVVHLGIGLSVLVGWNETNRRFPLSVVIAHEDGGDPVIQVEGQIEQGRPAGLTPGQDLRSVLAINAEIQFPGPGGYEVRAKLQDQIRSVSFRVHALPALGSPAST